MITVKTCIVSPPTTVRPNSARKVVKAVMIVRRDKKPSISYVQRQLRIGYNRAAILIEKMEEEGVISAPNISGKREVIEE